MKSTNIDQESTIDVPMSIIFQVLKYCDDAQIYDKLGKYNDFYYKLNQLYKEHLKNKSENVNQSNDMLEKDLQIYDIWEAPSKNIFIKISDQYSIGIGQIENHNPDHEWNELQRTQYVKTNDVTPVKRIGRLVFE